MNKLKAIEALENLSETINREEHNPHEANGVDRAISVLSNLPDDNPWITELPKDSELVKVYMTIRYPAGVATVKGIWNYGYFYSANGRLMRWTVLAWKYYRLPEPYKEVIME